MGPEQPPEPTVDEVRRRHPGWDVIEVFGGFEAVPEGTTVVRAMWLSILDAKLGSEIACPRD